VEIEVQNHMQYLFRRNSEMKWTWTKELFPIRRTLPLATAMDCANGRESSLVYMTPFLMIKSATNGRVDCGSFFHVRKSAKPRNGLWIHSYVHAERERERERVQVGWRRWREAMSMARSREIEAEITMWMFIWSRQSNHPVMCFFLNFCAQAKLIPPKPVS